MLFAPGDVIAANVGAPDLTSPGFFGQPTNHSSGSATQLQHATSLGKIEARLVQDPAHVADVLVAVHGGPADIHGNTIGLEGLKDFFFTG